MNPHCLKWRPWRQIGKYWKDALESLAEKQSDNDAQVDSPREIELEAKNSKGKKHLLKSGVL